MALRWSVLAGVAVGLIAVVGIDARATYGARTTADEPQYLLTATSIALDGDVDISNQLADQSYLPYHELRVDTQTRELDAAGRRVSPHDPLLPVLLTAPMAVAGWVGAKLALVVLAAITAGVTFRLAHLRYRSDRGAALVAVVGCFAGLPLAAYGTQVYPEMPAALLVVIGLGVLTGETWRTRTAALGVATIIALPWLAVKYVPVAAVLGVALLIRLRHRRYLAGVVLTVAVLAGVVFLWAHQVIYGGWTAYAAGDHFEATGEFSVVGTDADVLGRSRRLIGLLVDRRFGIAVWSPIWFLLPPAIAIAVFDVRRRSAEPGSMIPAVALIGTGWLTATFVALTMHGWWVPGRQLVVVLPVAAILIARWLSGSRRRVAVAAVLAGVGAANWLWLGIESTIGRRTLVVDFAETSSPFYRLMSPLFPDGITGGVANDLGVVAWLLLLTITAMVAWRLSDEPDVEGVAVIDPLVGLDPGVDGENQPDERNQREQDEPDQDEHQYERHDAGQ